jgi:HSP20 family protein
MVMIEAMACGTPVVALRAGSVPEVVVDGITGLIRDRPEQLADALREVTAISPAACRTHVAQQFSTANLASGYERAYRRVINRHTRQRSARPTRSFPTPRAGPATDRFGAAWRQVPEDYDRAAAGPFGAGPRGDLYLVVYLAPHPRYRVDGRDITVDLPVAPWEAAPAGRWRSSPTPPACTRNCPVCLVPSGPAQFGFVQGVTLSRPGRGWRARRPVAADFIAAGWRDDGEDVVVLVEHAQHGVLDLDGDGSPSVAAEPPSRVPGPPPTGLSESGSSSGMRAVAGASVQTQAPRRDTPVGRFEVLITWEVLEIMAESMLPATRSSSPVGRWDPWREFDELHARFNQLLNGVFEPLAAGRGVSAWTPLADVSETDEAYVVEVDVPGVKRDDLTVEATGNELVIAGELKDKERVGLLRSRTRRVGWFEYRASLPAHVNADGITADLSDGVLNVRVPKSEAAKPRRVEITGR